MANSVKTYEVVPVSSTGAVLGGAGAKGDAIERLVLIVSDATNAEVSLKDGTETAFIVFENNPAAGKGVYPIVLGGLASRNGSWKVITGSGVRVLAIGSFTQ